MTQKTNKKSKAFTLLELLVATTIFGIVMMMAMSAITDSANYLAKLKAMRVASEESRRIADILGENIKNANSEISVTFTSGGIVHTGELYKSGIALFSCTAAGACDATHSTIFDQSMSDSNAAAFGANTLVLGEKDTSGNLVYKVYYNNKDEAEPKLYYWEGSSLVLDYNFFSTLMVDANVIAGGAVADLDLQNNIIIKFGGYAPNSVTMLDSAQRQQSYVFYNINVNTRGTGLKRQELFNINVLSGVTSRNYN
ncbi:MAG: prepilin-type N-terminal cleavage/methylation domain-containing protein [Candidatus Berkelbacteria bacterium]